MPGAVAERAGHRDPLAHELRRAQRGVAVHFVDDLFQFAERQLPDGAVERADRLAAQGPVFRDRPENFCVIKWPNTPRVHKPYSRYVEARRQKSRPSNVQERISAQLAAEGPMPAQRPISTERQAAIKMLFLKAIQN